MRTLINGNEAEWDEPIKSRWLICSTSEGFPGEGYAVVSANYFTKEKMFSYVVELAGAAGYDVFLSTPEQGDPDAESATASSD